MLVMLIIEISDIHNTRSTITSIPKVKTDLVILLLSIRNSLSLFYIRHFYIVRLPNNPFNLETINTFAQLSSVTNEQQHFQIYTQIF